MWAIDFLSILGMTSKKTLVRADSTLAESAGRGPPRDCSDLATLLCRPHQTRGHLGQCLRGRCVFLVLPAIFFTWLALVPIGVYLCGM